MDTHRKPHHYIPYGILLKFTYPPETQNNPMGHDRFVFSVDLPIKNAGFIVFQFANS